MNGKNRILYRYVDFFIKWVSLLLVMVVLLVVVVVVLLLVVVIVMLVLLLIVVLLNVIFNRKRLALGQKGKTRERPLLAASKK